MPFQWTDHTKTEVMASRDPKHSPGKFHRKLGDISRLVLLELQLREVACAPFASRFIPITLGLLFLPITLLKLFIQRSPWTS